MRTNTNRTPARHRKTILALILLLLVTVAHPHSLSGHGRHSYDIYLNDKRVGAATRDVKIQDIGTEIRESITYREPGFLGSTDITVSRIEQYAPSGRLLFADLKHHQGETRYWSRMASVDGEIWVMASPITSASEKEDAQFVELALAAIGSASSAAGEVLSYSSLLLGGSQTRDTDARFPESDHLISLPFLPLHWLHAGKTLPDRLALLDSPHPHMREAKVTPFPSPAHSGHCYQLDLADKETLTLCMQQQADGIPHFSLLRRSTPGKTVEWRIHPQDQGKQAEKEES